MLVEDIIAKTTQFRKVMRNQSTKMEYIPMYTTPGKHIPPPQTQTVFCKGVSMIKGLLGKLPKEILLLRG